MKKFQMIRRLFALTLAVTFIVLLVVGCGNNEGVSSDPVSSPSGEGGDDVTGSTTLTTSGGSSASTEVSAGTDATGSGNGTTSTSGSSSNGTSSGGTVPTVVVNPADTSVATAVLGKTKNLANMTLTTPSGSDYSYSSRLGRESWMITGTGTVLSVKLSEAFIKQAGNKDLLVTLEYYGDLAGNFSVSYVQGSVTQKEIVYTKKTNSWTSSMLRLSNVRYGEINKQDFQLVFDGISMLRLASIVVTTSNVKLEQSTGIVAETTLAFNTPHVVKTKYATDESVVANVTVTYFGAVGDGKTDDTAAFQAALNCAEAQGGGTVFVPEGKYVIRSALTVPVGVTLRGESPKVDSKSAVKGTVLYSYVGKGSTDLYNDTAFITLNVDAGLRDLSIYYPEQTLSGGKATPYSWTVRMNRGSTVENVRLVNSYKGIHIGPHSNTVTLIRNVCGTPLYYGMAIDANTDIARFQNVTFSADCWMNSGVGSSPSKTALSSWLLENATAFLYERVDWTYFWDLTFDGYKIGMHSRKSANSTSPVTGKAGGQIYNVTIINCNICMLIEDVTDYGAHLTNSTLSATGGNNPVAIKLGVNFASSYMFNGCSIKSTGKNVITSAGSGAVTLTNCTVTGSGSATNLVEMTGKGKFSSTATTYSGGANHVRLASGVTGANMVNNMTKSTFKVKDETGGNATKLVYDSSETPVQTITGVKYDVTYTTKSNKSQLLDVSQAPYNIKPTASGAGKDISATLQKALNDMKAAGGGIVYVPAGDYRLDKSIVVPTGVELRGSSDVTIHNGYNITCFYTKYGYAKKNADPLIILSEKSGVYGFAVFHDYGQSIKSFAPYAYVIQGRGSDCYVVNVMLPNAYQGIDFATYKCDRHFLMGVYGCGLKVGIKVGGGSKDGVMRDCHMHAVAWIGTRFSPEKELGMNYGTMMDNVLLPALLASSDAIVIENTTNEVMYNNFAYGAWHGYILRDNADVFMMGNGADGVGVGMQFENITASKTTWVVASQLCVHGGVNNEAYIKTTGDFAGKLNMIQTLTFGHSPIAVSLNGSGTANLINLHIQWVWKNTTQTQMIVNVKNSMVVGCYFAFANAPHDIQINSNVGSAVLYANLFGVVKSPNIVVASGANVTGGDVA